MRNNFNNKDVKWMADYSDWDMQEVATTLTNLFPDAEEILIDGFEDETVYVQVDGKLYAIGPDGSIEDANNMEV